MRMKCLCPVALRPIAMILALLPVGSFAQSADPPDTYIPLFTQGQISKASKDARKRMQDTEQMNHAAWINRRKQDAEAQAKKAAETRAAAQPPASKYTRKGKIYKWVDAQGNVHFGDAPSGKHSQQIKLRNIQPPAGAAPPATPPHLKQTGGDT